MSSQGFVELRVYRIAEELSEAVWSIVRKWDRIAVDTIGKQIIRSDESIDANIAEGTARCSYQDNRRLVRIARGSLYETRHWLRRAHRRNLHTKEEIEILKPLMNDLGPRLNASLKSFGPMTELRPRGAFATLEDVDSLP